MITTCGIFLYSIPVRKILLCHATRSRWNLWSIPKGLKDPGESCLQSAIRELKEETGIDLTEINYTHSFELPPARYKKSPKILQSFLIATSDDLTDYKLNCESLVDGKYPEVDRFKWADLNEIKQLAHESQVSVLPLVESYIQDF